MPECCDPCLERLLAGQAQLQLSVAALHSSIAGLAEALQGSQGDSATDLRRIGRASNPSSPFSSKLELQHYSDQSSHAAHTASQGVTKADRPSFKDEPTGTTLCTTPTPYNNRISSDPELGPLNVSSASRIGLYAGLLPHPHLAECSATMNNNPDELVKDWAANLTPTLAHPSRLLTNIGPPSKAGLLLPLHPLSWVPTIFDCASVLVMLADALMVPVMIAWDIPPTGWLQVVAVFMLAFWTCDIILKFCTGYISGVWVVQNWSSIVKRYLKRTFVFDVLLVCIDLIDLIVTVTSSASRSGPLKAVRLLRFAKVTRMIRIVTRMSSSLGVARVGALVSVYSVRWFGATSSVTRYMNIVGVLAKLACAFLGFSHLLTCVWYFLLQNATPAGEESWKLSIPFSESKETYLFGVYLSLSTMIAGGSFLPPVLLWEVVFSTILILVGVLFVTAITSTMAATLIEAQLTWVEMNEKLANLTSFLEQEGFSDLALMIAHEDFVMNMTRSKAEVTEAHVLDQVSVLSKDVRILLRDLQFSASFKKVHVFCFMHSLYPTAVQELCGGANFVLIPAGHDIFDVHRDMAYAMLLSKGRAHYTQMGSFKDVSRSMTWTHAHHSSAKCQSVTLDSWMCEMALILMWKTVGRMEAHTNCELLSVSVEAFSKAATRLPAALAVISSYCEQVRMAFTQWNDDEGQLSDINPGLDGDFIATKMPRIVRRELVSAPVLECLRKQEGTISGLFKGSSIPGLEQEVMEGRCHLTTTETGDILRVVKLVVLHLRDERGNLCVQLAEGTKSSRSELDVNMRLPGQKVQDDPSPLSVVEQILDKNFSAFKNAIGTVSIEPSPVIEYARSESYGIMTKYVKIVARASLQGLVSVEPVVQSVANTLSARAGKGKGWGMAPSPARTFPIVPHAFAVECQDDSCRIYAWLSEQDYEFRWANKETETASLRTWLSQVYPQQLDTLLQWTLASDKGSAICASVSFGSLLQRMDSDTQRVASATRFMEEEV